MLPLIDDYFSNFNTIIPLFNYNSFKKLLTQWGENSRHSDPSVEASINVVLALSLQNRATSAGLANGLTIEHLTNNARSFMSSMMSRIQDLRGLQVLLGLAMLCQRTPDPQPALVLIAAAVQLAHRLRLHESVDEWDIDTETASERRCVFWIMYILDKDINVRASVPYMHQDHDTSVEAPSAFNEIDTAGIIPYHNGQLSFNFLAARFHLARIQGRVYDWTHSALYRGKSLHEKKPQIERLRTILRGWERAVPEEIWSNTLPENVHECARRQLLTLRFDYAYLLFKIHGVFLHDAEWIRLLADYSDRYAGIDNRNAPQHLATESWPELMEVARTTMRLFQVADQADDRFLWYELHMHHPSGLIANKNKDRIMCLYVCHDNACGQQAYFARSRPV